MGDEPPLRTTVLCCLDWPVVAAGASPDEAVAVQRAGRIIAASPAARLAGVRRGQRRREAQSTCPELVLLDHDPARDLRGFEPVAAAVETVTPLIEVIRPGVCAFATRGPSRYHGGDAAMMQRVCEVVAEVLGGCGEAWVGTADGLFAAWVAARRPDPAERLVPPGGSASFLASLPVGLLGRPELTAVLERLGLRTLGDLAALPRADVLARFGHEGAAAHRLAAGLDERPPDARPLPPSLEVALELDPPIERVDEAAFAAKSLADELHDRLAAVGLGCSLLLVRAETEHGERLERCWRHEGSLSAAGVAQRVRWQLDGWLTTSAASRPTSGLIRLSLVPQEVQVAAGQQLGLWGGRSQEGERAARALARIQGILGPAAVRVPRWRGGRDPASRVELVAAGTVHDDGALSGLPPPWPGCLPAPSPATVLTDPSRAEVLDAEGRVVGVSGRGLPSAAPHRISVEEGPWVEVVAWAGPWPVEERWWDPGTHRRRARFQVLTSDGSAQLLVLEGGSWSIEAIYD